jgi:hypothetical protein
MRIRTNELRVTGSDDEVTQTSETESEESNSNDESNDVLVMDTDEQSTESKSNMETHVSSTTSSSQGCVVLKSLFMLAFMTFCFMPIRAKEDVSRINHGVCFKFIKEIQPINGKWHHSFMFQIPSFPLDLVRGWG